ncbi:hypothetical protein F4678DRAFT_306401 [Xylaria arbuscula]|nr:hypothetical protein F4678DRAFT_306401 [Xylaria arbuscula]
MCDYTQVEYNCQHFRFVVLRWCPKYERTYKPCAPNVTHLEVRNNELCCMWFSKSKNCHRPYRTRLPFARSILCTSSSHIWH